ncbi:hypothetical protein AAVH_43078 [Aphelenchoides avenae]|nr:hypothetical protein AAVH_43078 [Aphelenchus avenae]
MMRNQRQTYGNYQPKQRFNNVRNQQQQRQEQPQGYSWTSLLRQMKLEHENCTDVQLAEKLMDPATAEKALHVLRCRKVSAPGHIRMRVIEGWDGPAESTKSIKDPSKSVLGWYQDNGLEIRCAYLPVLVVKEDANADAEQIPLEHLDVEAPIIRTKREPLPWMRKDAARPQIGGQNSASATSGNPQIAAPAQPIELATILGELEELKNKVEDKKSVKKSELKKLQADADEKERKLKAAESSVDQLRSLLEAFKQANPQAVLPEHDVLNRIVDGSEKAPEISGRGNGGSGSKKLIIDTSGQEKAAKPTPTSS